MSRYMPGCAAPGRTSLSRTVFVKLSSQQASLGGGGKVVGSGSGVLMLAAQVPRSGVGRV